MSNVNTENSADSTQVRVDCGVRYMPMSQENILNIARKTLDTGLDFGRTTRITRATDKELIDFANAITGTWMPIDTAPRDERVLLWNGTGMYCGHWAKSIETDDEAWIIAEFGNEGEQLLTKATHWLPLPEPPEST